MHMECNRKIRTEIFLLKLFLPSQTAYSCLQKRPFCPPSQPQWNAYIQTDTCNVIVICHTQGISLGFNKKSDNRIASLIWKLKCLIELLPRLSILTPSFTWRGVKSIIVITPTTKRIKLYGSEIFTAETPAVTEYFAVGTSVSAYFE